MAPHRIDDQLHRPDRVRAGLLPAQADSAAAAAATIRQEETSWIEALAAGQIDATVSYYGDGALLLAPNAPIAQTKEQIRQT